MRSKTTARATAVLVAVAALTTSGGAVAAPQSPGGPRYTAGAAGAGDDYFPYAGNGGYDVHHYDLDITYTPPPPAPAPLEGRLMVSPPSTSSPPRISTASIWTCAGWTFDR